MCVIIGRWGCEDARWDAQLRLHQLFSVCSSADFLAHRNVCRGATSEATLQFRLRVEVEIKKYIYIDALMLNNTTAGVMLVYLITGEAQNSSSPAFRRKITEPYASKTITVIVPYVIIKRCFYHVFLLRFPSAGTWLLLGGLHRAATLGRQIRQLIMVTNKNRRRSNSSSILEPLGAEMINQ